jgi:hypothetical protein
MRKVLVGIGGALPTIALVANGCRTATQVKLDIQTNVDCARMRGVDIVVAAQPDEAERRSALLTAGTRFPTASTTDCTPDVTSHIGSLVITPSSGGGAVVVIGAFGNTRAEDCKVGSFTEDCIVARRVFSFVDHQEVTLPVMLDATCAGIPCNANSTCVAKKCVSSHVECASGTCAQPGEVSSDGGLVEVDGSSPVLDGASVPPPPPPPPVPPGPPPPGDGGQDATTDGPTEGGTGTCLCIGGLSCAPGDTCCYDPAGTSCKPAGSCAFIHGCCRDSRDCGGDLCCGSTFTGTPTTEIKCAPACLSGRQVCVVTGPGTGCIGGAGYCTPSPYSPPPPSFYGCS